MDIAKLKNEYNRLQIAALVLSVVIIAIAVSPGDVIIYASVPLIILAVFVLYKRSYWGGTIFIIISLGVFCFPYLAKKMDNINLGYNKLFLLYIIANLIYLELMSRLRINHYFYKKYRLSASSVFTTIKKRHSGITIIKDLSYRLLVCGGIYILFAFIYNLLQKYSPF